MIPIVLLWIWTTLLVLYSNSAEETALQKPPAILLPPEEEQWLFWLGYKASCPFGRSSSWRVRRRTNRISEIMGFVRIFWKNSVHDPRGLLAKNEHFGANCHWDINPYKPFEIFWGSTPQNFTDRIRKTENRTWWRLRLEYLLKSKIKCVKLKPVSCVLLAKYRRHVQNYSLQDYCCCRLISIVIDFYRLRLDCLLINPLFFL